MALTARTWVDGELASAAKLNTLRDDILELDAVAGFNSTQYGSITINDPATTGDATVSAMSARDWPVYLGHTDGGPGNLEGVRLSKVNSTTIRATRLSSSSGVTSVVNFAIVGPRG